MTDKSFNPQHEATELRHLHYLWATFVRRAQQSATALEVAAEAFSAFAHEMKAYDQYQELQQQEALDLQAYEPILSYLAFAGDDWWSAVFKLQNCAKETLPTGFTQEGLITTCLEQRVRLFEVSLHLLKLQLTAHELESQRRERQSQEPTKEAEQ